MLFKRFPTSIPNLPRSCKYSGRPCPVLLGLRVAYDADEILLLLVEFDLEFADLTDALGTARDHV